MRDLWQNLDAVETLSTKVEGGEAPMSQDLLEAFGRDRPEFIVRIMGAFNGSIDDFFVVKNTLFSECKFVGEGALEDEYAYLMEFDDDGNWEWIDKVKENGNPARAGLILVLRKMVVVLKGIRHNKERIAAKREQERRNTDA